MKDTFVVFRLNSKIQKTKPTIKTGHVPCFNPNIRFQRKRKRSGHKYKKQLEAIMVSLSVSVSQKEEKLNKIEKEELTWPFLPMTSLLKILEISSYTFPSSLAESTSSLPFHQLEEKQKSEKSIKTEEDVAKDGEAMQVEQVETKQEKQIPVQMISNVLESSVNSINSNLNLPSCLAEKNENKPKDIVTVGPGEHPSNAELRTILSHLELILVVHQTLKPLFSPLVNKKQVSFLDLLRTLIKESDAIPASLSKQSPQSVNSKQRFRGKRMKNVT